MLNISHMDLSLWGDLISFLFEENDDSFTGIFRGAHYETLLIKRKLSDLVRDVLIWVQAPLSIMEKK